MDEINGAISRLYQEYQQICMMPDSPSRDVCAMQLAYGLYENLDISPKPIVDLYMQVDSILKNSLKPLILLNNATVSLRSVIMALLQKSAPLVKKAIEYDVEDDEKLKVLQCENDENNIRTFTLSYEPKDFGITHIPFGELYGIFLIDKFAKNGIYYQMHGTQQMVPFQTDDAVCWAVKQWPHLFKPKQPQPEKETA